MKLSFFYYDGNYSVDIATIAKVKIWHLRYVINKESPMLRSCVGDSGRFFGSCHSKNIIQREKKGISPTNTVFSQVNC